LKVILIGEGKTVYFLAKRFASKGYYLTIISRDPAEATVLSRQVRATVLVGDGSDPAVLEEAGVRQADVVLSLTPLDQDNLVACQIAQQMFGVPRTIALVNDPDHEAVFRQLGLTTAISTTQIITSLIEQKAGFEDITNLIPVAEGKVNVTEVSLRHSAPTVGKSLRELNLPENSLIACIIRDGQVIVPRGESRLQAADRLILMSLPENYGQALRILTGEEV
jgi:trk system potassium uptake protein TrkA